MSVRRNRQRSPRQKTTGDQLQRAFDWAFTEDIFADVKLHGKVSWKVVSLVRLAILWAWSEDTSLVRAASDAIDVAQKLFGSAAVHSYQALTNALKRYTPQILPVVWRQMHKRMEESGQEQWRVGHWVALAVDGSRTAVPRTIRNEQRYCKPRSLTKKGKRRKRRGRHAHRKPQEVRQKSHYNPQPVGPQMWITLLWHIGMQIPWAWKVGPSYSSERHHFLEMFTEDAFPDHTLFCGDAGFTGHEFWQTIEDHGHAFLCRVGSNVGLLRNLGHTRGRRDIVYCWPDTAAKKKCRPLPLRLLHLIDHRNRHMYLVTNVLDRRKLTDSQAQEIYRMRWGIEVQFRSLKQTYDRSKLRSRTPECAEIELHWSLVGLSVIQLFAVKDRIQIGDPNEQTSVAAALRIFRGIIRDPSAVPAIGASLQQQLASAVTDNYDRKSKKKSRNFPRRKEEPATGKPKIKLATSAQRRKARRLLELVHAA